MNLSGLDLPARSAALGFASCADYLRFASEHPDLCKAPLTPASIARARRHDDAGRPAPDFTRLVYLGSGVILAVLIATLKKLPAAFAWHCTEFVCWMEVGRNAGAWMTRPPTMRAPNGDAAHLIVLNGAASDRALEHVIVHEASHSWHKLVVADTDAPEPAPMPEQEWLARRLLVYRDEAQDAAGAFARALYANERLADDTATAFGFPPLGHSSSIERLRGFEAEIAAATPLADEIEREIDSKHHVAERAAATLVTTEGAV